MLRMRRLIDMIRMDRVTDDPVAMLWHYCLGQLVEWKPGSDTEVIWKGASHRGVQWLHKVEFPRKQKRYIFAPQFEIRYNQAFEEVIRACADLKREGRTWVSEDYIRGMCRLNEMGFAHSYEAWQDGKLVGGAFGLQLGSLVTCDSMFHRVSNASKAAYGQTLVHLQNRGFKIVDTNGVAKHQVNYGEEWMPQWQFEKLLYDCVRDPSPPALVEGRPYPKMPWEIRAMLPALRAARKVARRLPWHKPQPPMPPTTTPTTTPGAEAQQGSTQFQPPDDGAARPDGGSGTPPSQAATTV
jgi:leucyl/phenylalanyl-tRNA---protein transferase